MANIINRQQTFATNGTVDAASLHNLIDSALVNSAIIKNQDEITTIGTSDLLLIAPSSVDAALAPRKVTVQNLFDDGLTSGTFTSLNLSGALTYGTATGNRTVSTSATITNGTVTTLNSTTGTIQALTTGTTTSTNEVVTNGTITNLSATTSTFLGTITGSTNVVNIGSGQIYKDASGNVGIGVASPISSIHVKQATPVSKITLEDLSTNRVGQIGGGSDGDGGFLSFLIGNNSGSITERMRISAAGEVFIAGTTDQGIYNLQVNGTGVWGAGAYVNGSDSRIKEDIQPIASGLDVVEKLNPVTYKYKETWSSDQSIQSGFIAQELLTALDGQIYVAGVVQQGGTEGYYSVAYQNLIPVLSKAIQELKAKNDSLEARLQALEAK